VSSYVVSDRPSVKRTWEFPRGDARCAWIRGRAVSATAGDERYEATFVAHLEKGFPPKIADALGAEVALEVRAAVEALNPLPCFCGTGGDKIEHWDTIETFITRWDPRAPVDVMAAVGHCTVCHRGWTFEWSGDPHYSYTYTANEFFPMAGYAPEEVDLILEGLRAGAEAMVGVSRCHTTYRGKDGAIVAEDFDEGMTEERACSEDTVRRAIRDDPQSFIEVLRAPFRTKLRDALLANVGVPEAMCALLAYGECLFEVEILEAVLEDKTPPLEGKTGLDVYHAIMSAIGYGTKTAAAGEFGLRVFAALDGKDLPRFHRYRAPFRAMAGDRAGALEDLVWEKAHMAGEADESLDREIEQMK
jgi:hypothetical protein